MIKEKIATWGENLGLLEGMERLSYLVDLSKSSTTLPEELRTDDRLVTGCVSKIWVDVGLKENKINVYYDSDAMITKGITRVVCECFTGASKQEALDTTIEDFAKLGVRELLTPQRQNGLSRLIITIQQKIEAL
jgi:cysteine desulfuration protein SufE